MLNLDDFGVLLAAEARLKRIVCQTPDAAIRLLRILAEDYGKIQPQYRVRIVTAVIDWICENQEEQAETLNGAARMLLDAAQRVGEVERKK